MHALPTAIPIAKQQKKNYYIFYYYLLITLSKDMERQSNKVSEQQRCAPSLHFWTRPLCTTTPCPLQDEVPLHSMPPFGRGPSALLLHASIWTRPLCTAVPCPLQDEAPSARTVLLQIKTSAETTTLHAEDIANRQLSPISI